MELQVRVEELEGQLENTRDELQEAREALALPPAWGDCRRGCPPAFLDREGFCSPACVLGAPRGQYVTVKES